MTLFMCAALIATCVGCAPGGGRGAHGGGQTIRTAPGKEFTLTLVSNRTTGYGWQLSELPDKAIAQFISSEYVAPYAPRAVGAGGKELWRFRAIGRGTTTIGLVYVRPWEKSAAPADEARFTIIVK